MISLKLFAILTIYNHSLIPNNFIHLVFLYFKILVFGSSTKSLQSFLAWNILLANLYIISMWKYSIRARSWLTNVWDVEVTATSESRPIGSVAVNETWTVYRYHLLPKVHLHQKSFFTFVLDITCRMIPLIVRIACNSFFKLCPSNHKSVLDVITNLMKLRCPETMTWCFKYQFYFDWMVQCLADKYFLLFW